MKKRFAEYEFSIGLRLTHWLRALCITILVITGYYIAFVFTAPEVSPEPVLFMQAKFRFVHLIFGFALWLVSEIKSKMLIGYVCQGEQK